MVFTDAEWAETAQDIPGLEDPLAQQYLKGREALIEEESKQRSDHAFRMSLSPTAKQACDIVGRIRDEELQSTWTGQVEDALAVQGGAPLHPGMMFSLAKERMEGTRLWRIVRRMPKGCLLHAHMDAMVEFDYLVGVLLAEPGMHIVAPDGPLATDAARAAAAVGFRFLARARRDADVWADDYRAGTPVLLTQAADAFPAGEGGRPGFVKWLISRCIISSTDALDQHHGIDAIWEKFRNCFMVVGTIIHYEPIFRAFLRRLMSSLKADGVNWIEIRFTWPLDYYRAGREEPESDYTHMMQVLEEELAAFKSSDEGAGFWGLRIIWTTFRGLATRAVVENMAHCIATKRAFPQLIAGYDVVGQEDAGRPLRDLLPELLWFRRQSAGAGVELPFFFHAGECLGSGDATDRNLFDAVLLGTRRIGHGFSPYKHPLLVARVRRARVLVEACPISNEVLRLCGSVSSHPLPALLARGVACALCNDDPAMLGQDTAGMTHDFWQALQGWHDLGLAGLGSLAENSIRWAAFEDQPQDVWDRDVEDGALGSGTKAQRLKEWARDWEEFCRWIVAEFGTKSET